jgi:hypothetical protein
MLMIRKRKNRMRKNRIDVTRLHPWLATLLLITGLFIAAFAAKTTIPSVNAASTPFAKAATTQKPVPGATTALQANTTGSNPDCGTIGKANIDFGMTLPNLSNPFTLAMDKACRNFQLLPDAAVAYPPTPLSQTGRTIRSIRRGRWATSV